MNQNFTRNNHPQHNSHRDRSLSTEPIARNVLATREAIRRAEAGVELSKIRTRAQCLHQKDGGITIEKANGLSKFTNAQLYKCKYCGDNQIDISQISNSELDEGINTLIRAFNMIKMSLDVSKPQDKDTYEKIKNVQYFTEYDVRKLIEGVRSKNNNGKKKNKGNGGAAFSRARII